MSSGEPLGESAEELYEEAPCGYLATDPGGMILRVNRTFERWMGYGREELVGKRRFQELLSAGGRIYHETHYAPMLRMQGAVREIAVDLIRADGSRLPALLNSTLEADGDGEPRLVKTTVFDATERRSYERELLAERRRVQELARKLQASLLSGRLPRAPGVGVEVAYRPGVADLEVGGDWYDVFWLEPDRRLALVVGDVVGRGLEAAASMGQLRSAVRALASTGLEPAGLLTALDAYSARHGVGASATVLFCDLCIADGRLLYAAAGHLPPLLVPPDGEPQFLWDGRSLPVGTGIRTDAPRAQAETVLSPGSRLLLYTDGLIERRTSSLPDDLERLKRAVAARRALPAAALKDELMLELPAQDHPDDVCLVALAL